MGMGLPFRRPAAVVTGPADPLSQLAAARLRAKQASQQPLAPAQPAGTTPVAPTAPRPAVDPQLDALAQQRMQLRPPTPTQPTPPTPANMQGMRPPVQRIGVLDFGGPTGPTRPNGNPNGLGGVGTLQVPPATPQKGAGGGSPAAGGIAAAQEAAARQAADAAKKARDDAYYANYDANRNDPNYGADTQDTVGQGKYAGQVKTPLPPAAAAPNADLDELALLRQQQAADKAKLQEQAAARAGFSGGGLSGSTSAMMGDLSRTTDRTNNQAIIDTEKAQADRKFKDVQRNAVLDSMELADDHDYNKDGTIAGQKIGGVIGNDNPDDNPGAQPAAPTNGADKPIDRTTQKGGIASHEGAVSGTIGDIARGIAKALGITNEEAVNYAVMALPLYEGGMGIDQIVSLINSGGLR